MQNLSFFILFFFLAPFGFLPLRWSQAIGAYLGIALIHYNKKRAHIAKCNIRTAFPHLSKDEQKLLLRQTAQESGKWFIESSYVWFRRPDYLIKKVSVTNPELLSKAHQENKGVVLVLPHLGNWEFLNFYVPQRYTFGAMYKPVKSPIFENIIFKARSRVGSSMFATDSRGVRQAMKALKNKGVVAILSDHLPSRRVALYAPFFKQPALTGKLTHALVKSNQSPILLASVLRKPKGQGFEITFHEMKDMHTSDPLIAATALNKAIEQSILLAPEQYQWVYRRFAHPPEGAKDVYKQAEKES